MPFGSQTSTTRFVYDGDGNRVEQIDSGSTTVYVGQSYEVTTPTVATLGANLVSYWNLDEASGTRADAVGANPLTVINNPGSATGKVAGAAQFIAASHQGLQNTSASTLSGGDTNFAMALWFYVDQPQYQILLSKDAGGASQLEYLLELSSSNGLRFYVSANGSSWSPSVYGGQVVTGTWYFVVVQHDATNNQLSIQVNNGAIVTSSYSSGVFAGTGAFYVGNQAGSDHVSGRIDELGFWRRTLTTAERTALYNAGAGLAHPYPSTRSDYYAGVQRVAEPVQAGANNTLYYLHGDHLGSATLATCGSSGSTSACATLGAVVAQQYYYPWGQPRSTMANLIRWRCWAYLVAVGGAKKTGPAGARCAGWPLRCTVAA